MRRLALTAAARVLPPQVFAGLHCMAKLGYVPNLRSPETFTERVLAKRVFDRNPLIPVTADKYTLREYVSDTVGEQYLPELYAVVESIKDLNLDALPPHYVMKGSHGSGWNRIVTDSDLDYAEAANLAENWLARSFYRKRQEWAYKNLRPRVLFEENLAPGGAIDDFKVFVFAGTPRLIQVDRDRFSHHKRTLFTPEWREVAVECEYPLIGEPIAVPSQLGLMVELASALASPFEFARVDFYSLPERIVVGEITHYPEGGVVRFDPRSFDSELGAVWSEQRPVGEAFLAP